jgi:hypothetical protein
MTHSFARRNPSSSHCVQHCPSIRAPDWLPTITRTACGVRIHSPIPFQFPEFRILPNNQYSWTEQHRTISGARGGAVRGERAGGRGVGEERRVARGWRGQGTGDGPAGRGARGGWVPGEGRQRPGGRMRADGRDRLEPGRPGGADPDSRGILRGLDGMRGLPTRTRKSPTLLRMGRGGAGEG